MNTVLENIFDFDKLKNDGSDIYIVEDKDREVFLFRKIRDTIASILFENEIYSIAEETIGTEEAPIFYDFVNFSNGGFILYPDINKNYVILGTDECKLELNSFLTGVFLTQKTISELSNEYSFFNAFYSLNKDFIYNYIKDRQSLDLLIKLID